MCCRNSPTPSVILTKPCTGSVMASLMEKAVDEEKAPEDGQRETRHSQDHHRPDPASASLPGSQYPRGHRQRRHSEHQGCERQGQRGFQALGHQLGHWQLGIDGRAVRPGPELLARGPVAHAPACPAPEPHGSWRCPPAWRSPRQSAPLGRRAPSAAAGRRTAPPHHHQDRRQNALYDIVAQGRYFFWMFQKMATGETITPESRAL